MHNNIILALVVLTIMVISLISCKTLSTNHTNSSTSAYSSEKETAREADDSAGNRATNQKLVEDYSDAYPCKMMWVKTDNGDWKITIVEN